ncbi:bifunctional lysylphosphatidylglycerol synthetase/lysine--tRNA ligase LysX [Nocardia jinanensis]|uniref:Lysylphosphatidylglycerol biosynthesis bifunctional protein LysX n=1 Tax=Nocardia jinanensis TaxID=382504 RepID=A0A917VX46_9NOCA|nr:bifunctional lysylphosphatidylglycerol synthetase/lysine--tRNA ligase LysX [Nocardia jinanensis]GGL25808.1 lysylphosphatidylglycerol biosynthesis bifunctional protein LysX [Nocardia jinanensis]
MISTQEPRYPESPGRSGTPGRFAAIPRVAALISGVLATACLLWSLSPALSAALGGVRHYLDRYYLYAPDTNLLWAGLTGWLAIGLTGHKRVAWWAMVLYLASWIPVNLTDVVRAHDRHAAIAALAHSAVLLLLILSRSEFGARFRRCAPRPAALSLAAGLLIAAVAGCGVVQVFPGSVPSAAQRALWVVSELTANLLPGTSVSTGTPPFPAQFLVGLFGALAFAAAVLVLHRTRRAEYALTDADEAALRDLLEGPDPTGSIDYLATRRDRELIFTPNGRAAIGYRVEHGICLALGDPIGARDSWPQAVETWQRYAHGFGWRVAVIGASKAAVSVYQRAGLTAMTAGAEAVLDTRSFSLAAPELQPVRQSVARLRKQGVTVRIRRHRDIGTSELARLTVCAEDWRHSETERGYPLPLGRLGDRRDGDCLLIEAVDPDERVLGLLSLVPWGKTGATMELLRRAPDSPAETTDLLIAEFALRAEQHGIHQVSLSFTLFRSVFEAVDRVYTPTVSRAPLAVLRTAAGIARSARTLPLAFSRWWQQARLHRASMRYQPRWVPRYVLCDTPRDLARIAVAAAYAEGLMPGSDARSTAFTYTGRHRTAPEHPSPAPPGTSAAIRESDPEPAPAHRPEQVRVRTGKLERLADANIDPYPLPYPPTHTVAAARRTPRGTTVRVSGRLLRRRDYGGVIFAVVRDWTSDIQLLLDRDRLGRQRLDEFGDLVDLGDLVSVSGQLGYSRRGELSLLVADWRMLGKCLHPLPDKWRGLSDPEVRMRRGYLDLMIDREARELLARRSAVLRTLRDALHDYGFLEVTTPVLQHGPGGSATHSLRTQIDADNTDLHLRVAPELSLKRLCVGGVEKLFELGPGFRNTRADTHQLPEFTLLEAYEAHSDHRRMMTLCRRLVQQAALAANDSMIAMRPTPDGSLAAVDISGEWRVRSMYGALAEEIGIGITPRTPLPELRELCEKADIVPQPGWDAGRTAYALYQRLVVEATREPTFYTDFPSSVSPLARPDRHDGTLAERWDLVAWGIELASGSSELTDPVEQRRRLAAQSRIAADGGRVAMELDEEFLCALEHAMPPTGGLGLGVDRVIMLLTGRPLRETQTFPLVRPR